MSGGEPSSIKRDVPCAARAPVPQLHAEDCNVIAYLFYYILCKLATKNFPLSEKNSLYNRENYGIILSAVA